MNARKLFVYFIACLLVCLTSAAITSRVLASNCQVTLTRSPDSSTYNLGDVINYRVSSSNCVRLRFAIDFSRFVSEINGRDYEVFNYNTSEFGAGSHTVCGQATSDNWNDATPLSGSNCHSFTVNGAQPPQPTQPPAPPPSGGGSTCSNTLSVSPNKGSYTLGEVIDYRLDSSCNKLRFVIDFVRGASEISGRNYEVFHFNTVEFGVGNHTICGQSTSNNWDNGATPLSGGNCHSFTVAAANNPGGGSNGGGNTTPGSVGMNVLPWCQMIGFTDAKYLDWNDPYSWRCTKSDQSPRKVDFNGVCALSSPNYPYAGINENNAYGWRCYNTVQSTTPNMGSGNSSNSNETTGTNGCVNDSEFVTDVTIPDGTTMPPHQNFIKTWRMRNNGTCTWTNQYRFKYYGDDKMSGGVLSFPTPVNPGATVDISVSFIASNSPGNYTSTWRIADQDGNWFGQHPYLKIIVQPGAPDLPVDQSDASSTNSDSSAGNAKETECGPGSTPDNNISGWEWVDASTYRMKMQDLSMQEDNFLTKMSVNTWYEYLIAQNDQQAAQYAIKQLSISLAKKLDVGFSVIEVAENYLTGSSDDARNRYKETRKIRELLENYDNQKYRCGNWVHVQSAYWDTTPGTSWPEWWHLWSNYLPTNARLTCIDYPDTCAKLYGVDISDYTHQDDVQTPAQQTTSNKPWYCGLVGWTGFFPECK